LLQIAIDIQAVAETRTGVGQFTYHLVKALSGAGSGDRYTLFLFDFRRRFRDPSLEFENVRVQKIRLPGMLLRKIWDRVSWPPLERLTGAFDLFHFTNYLVPPMRGSRALTTIYDLGFLRHPRYADPKALEALSRNLRKSVERAAGVITVSEFSKSEIMDLLGLPDSMVEVVYPGVSPSLSGHVDEPAILRVRRKYGLSGPYILFVGTIEPRKNLNGLLQAFRILKDRYSVSAETGLVIAGSKGWLYDETLETIQTLGLSDCTFLLGRVSDEDLHRLYVGARCHIHTAYYEGFGLPPLEAMACGTPTIVSNVSSLPEVVNDAALLVDPRDWEEIAVALHRLLTDDDLHAELRRKGLQRAACFSWEQAARQTLDVYRAVIEAPISSSNPPQSTRQTTQT